MNLRNIQHDTRTQTKAKRITLWNGRRLSMWRNNNNKLSTWWNKVDRTRSTRSRPDISGHIVKPKNEARMSYPMCVFCFACCHQIKSVIHHRAEWASQGKCLSKKKPRMFSDQERRGRFRPNVWAKGDKSHMIIFELGQFVRAKRK